MKNKTDTKLYAKKILHEKLGSLSDWYDDVLDGHLSQKEREEVNNKLIEYVDHCYIITSKILKESKK